MKIRTSFVTNSSSSSMAEIIIDNAVLLEILQRYKNLGVFGNEEYDFGIGSRSEWGHDDEITKTPAFSYFETDDAYISHPNSIDEVLENIIWLMSYQCDIQPENKLFEKMEGELLKRKEEIDAGYSLVIWRGKFSAKGGMAYYEGEAFEWDFRYDLVSGEKYIYNGTDENGENITFYE